MALSGQSLSAQPDPMVTRWSDPSSGIPPSWMRASQRPSGTPAPDEKQRRHPARTIAPGAKHCAMNILYSLQHLGYVIPPQADSGWMGEAGPGPSYLDPGSGGPENDFTNRNTTFMTWNLVHLARMLKEAGGIPAHGNQRSEWDAGCRFDFENPEHR